MVYLKDRIKTDYKLYKFTVSYIAYMQLVK